jgi:hypothetical protein
MSALHGGGGRKMRRKWVHEVEGVLWARGIELGAHHGGKSGRQRSRKVRAHMAALARGCDAGQKGKMAGESRDKREGALAGGRL